MAVLPEPAALVPARLRPGRELVAEGRDTCPARGVTLDPSDPFPIGSRVGDTRPASAA